MTKRLAPLLLSLLALAPLTGCDSRFVPAASVVAAAGDGNGVQSAIPADRLATIKAALPQVAFPELTRIFGDSSTFWYDAESMQRSYQESGSPGGGARDNAHWIDLVADTGSDDINSNPMAGGRQVYDAAAKNWRFPFAATAGTDDSTNIKIVNFLSLPKDSSGRIQTIPLSTGQDQLHLWWQWQYPNGTTVGEVMFTTGQGGGLTAVEVRIRKRYASGWATNAFRPFPTSASLSAAIKAKRPGYGANQQLNAMVQHLDGSDGMAAKQLTAVGLPGTFDQSGALDVLPEFGDDALVHELLTTTTFASAYGQTWKEAGGAKAYAASTEANVSIVPNHYAAGLIEVNETSCMRCHKETGRELEQWYPGLTLYGEIWGKDAIFTFHPFDESFYGDLDLNLVDNRHVNPKLSGMVETFDAAKHSGPFYDRR